MNILMVCLGNICRSPLAEGILKSKIPSSRNIFIDSAGTQGYHVGNTPDPRSIKVALNHGIDISKQVCRKLQQNDFDRFDILYAMDKSNYQNILWLARNEEDKQKVKLILNETSLQIKEVPDPYHDTEDGFEKVFQMLDLACSHIADKINNP